MGSEVSRRSFIGVAGVAVLGAAAARESSARMAARTRPVVIASGNGERAVEQAYARLTEGWDPLDATVDGVRIIEDDPDDMTVGYGGLPNEDGVVQLDAAVMHGPTHRYGAVGALEKIKNPAAVAREIARRTDHCLLVGEGASKFALRVGFKEENLLTDKARQAWLSWRAGLNRKDDWLDEDQFDLKGVPPIQHSMGGKVPFTTGTVHCSAVTAEGDLACVTSTSGLSYKLPGRVGDSPIAGAGLYVDNEVGAAGATGRGEAVMQICGSHSVIEHMSRGLEPGEACKETLKLLVKKTKAERLLRRKGEPEFNVSLYALRKDGVFGGYALTSGASMVICDEFGTRTEMLGHFFPRF